MGFNPFDVATKELVWDEPAAVIERFGVVCLGAVDVIDSDITTLSASADKVIRVSGPEPYLVDIEFQSYHDSDLVRTLWYRQVALDYRHNLPVLTLLVLLRKEANSPHLTGNYERNLPDGFQPNCYNYKVVRLWEDDPELYLNAGVTLVPLAPLANVSRADLPGVVERMKERIGQEAPPHAAKLFAAAYLLMGLRYDEGLTKQLFEGINAMMESTTYQGILRDGRNEGRLDEAQRMLRILGTKRFGTPSPATAAALKAIQDVERLEALGERVLEPDLDGWDDLLRGA